MSKIAYFSVASKRKFSRLLLSACATAAVTQSNRINETTDCDEHSKWYIFIRSNSATNR